MKKWMCWVLAAMLLVASAAAEPEWVFDDGFGSFDEGYDGSWLQVEALDFEFCLPKGWEPVEAMDGAAFAAVKDGGDASLSIRLAGESTDGLAAWGAANLKDSKPATANFYDVLLTGNDHALNVYLIVSGDSVVAFDFTRTTTDALSMELALQIVGSACELWGDDDVPLLEGDGDFDFTEAFEAELG